MTAKRYTMRCVYDSEVDLKVRRFIVLIRGIRMMRRFTKKELKRLGCSDEEISLILRCQKILPIMFSNDSDEAGFCIDARQLHTQLAIGKKFATWITDKIKKCKFVENTDYITVSQNRETANGGYTQSIEYKLNLRMAEHLCMAQNCENGFIMRDYFCLMEKIVIINNKWWNTRYPQKENYKSMCSAISCFTQSYCARSGDDSDFSREANIINRIATGCSALEIKNYLGVGVNDLTRDNLTNEYNEKIAFLQQQNILLLGMGMPIIQRVKMLISFFDIKYPDAKPLQNYYDRAYLISARKKIIEELER